MQWILNRLREPSTWKGIILLASLGGVTLSPEMKEAIISAGTALIGAIWVFQQERVNGVQGTAGDGTAAPAGGATICTDTAADQHNNTP